MLDIVLPMIILSSMVIFWISYSKGKDKSEERDKKISFYTSIGMSFGIAMSGLFGSDKLALGISLGAFIGMIIGLYSHGNK